MPLYRLGRDAQHHPDLRQLQPVQMPQQEHRTPQLRHRAEAVTDQPSVSWASAKRSRACWAGIISQARVSSACLQALEALALCWTVPVVRRS